MFTILLQAVIVLTISFVLWKRQSFVKSALGNLPGPPSQSLFFGTFARFLQPDGWEFHKEIEQKYGCVMKIPGFLGENMIYVFDPKALHHIFVKEQHIYEETSLFVEAFHLLFGPGLLGTSGDQHRKHRRLLNPAFSIAHLRRMVPMLFDISNKLRDTLARKTKDGPQEIDLYLWMTRTSLELIGQSGFGYSFEPLTEDGVAHPYSTAAKLLSPTISKIMADFMLILRPSQIIGTPKFRRFIFNISLWKNFHNLRDMRDVFYNTSVEIFEAKKKALKERDKAQIDQGNDILSILIRSNISSAEEDRMSREELMGQITTFTLAGMDTTSGMLARLLHLLSMHQDVQTKLRQEIVDARNFRHGNLGYDELVALPYLDAVCRETLRLYPPVSSVLRNTNKDVVLPLSTPVKGLDGREITEIPIPKNTFVFIGILASNRNPKIWGPDSYEWKPERWLTPLPASVSAARIPGVYSNLMTFIAGNKACIGFKLAELEMKVVLSSLIESFEFTPSKKEIFWEMLIFAAPIVVGEGRRHQLPLMVNSVRPIV